MSVKKNFIKRWYNLNLNIVPLWPGGVNSTDTVRYLTSLARFAIPASKTMRLEDHFSDPNRIRIRSGQWIRIRIRIPNPDPGGQK